MAEGGEVTGHREGLIQKCKPCNIKGTEKAATKYCFMCETPFCQECTELHYSLLSNHRVSELESATVGAQLTSYAELCPQHGKALRLYCKDHDSICCDECIVREHLSCNEVVFLPTSAHEVVNNIEVDEIKSKLRRTIEQLESIQINQQNNVINLEADRDKCLKELGEHHTELLDLLEWIAKSSKDQINQIFERFSVDLQRHQHEVEECLVDLKSTEKRLERIQDNAFPLFVELKKCQKQLVATEEVSINSLENLKFIVFSVDVDERLHTLLNELESLVTVLKHGPVQVKKKYQVDVSSQEDKKTCCIFGSCILSEGSILLVDYNNKMLKYVEQHSLEVRDQCPLLKDPMDVCVINNREVAVIHNNNNVVIASVRPSLTSIRTISMDNHCAYVAYSNGELFVTDESKALSVFNMEGSLLRKVPLYPPGQEIFSDTSHVAVSTAGDNIYVADIDNGLIILDREGQVQEKLVIDNIRGTQGICLDGMGGLFVCGYFSNNVVHVGSDGKNLTEVLTMSDGLVEPLSVCYDRINRRLVVTQFDSNQIHVCEFE